MSDSRGARARHALATAGTFSLITTLWYFWNAPSVADWFELVTWWRIG